MYIRKFKCNHSILRLREITSPKMFHVQLLIICLVSVVSCVENCEISCPSVISPICGKHYHTGKQVFTNECLMRRYNCEKHTSNVQLRNYCGQMMWKFIIFRIFPNSLIVVPERVWFLAAGKYVRIHFQLFQIKDLPTEHDASLIYVE